MAVDGGQPGLAFTEPNLAFQVAGRFSGQVTLNIELDLEFSVAYTTLLDATSCVSSTIDRSSSPAPTNNGATLVDQDEKPAGVKIEGMFRSAPTIESRFGAPGLTPVSVPIQGLQIDRPGEYIFTISVDGDELDRYSFDVIQIANVNVQAPASPAAE